jgi:sarcosine oxidase
MPNYDAIVIGSGCFGSWTALRLRQSGRSVLLVDHLGPGNPQSSSGGASRLIRFGYGPDEIYTRWSIRSLEAWREVFQRIRRPELFQHTGVLWTARPGHPHAEGTKAVFEKLSVPHEVLDAKEIERRFPLLKFPFEVTGIFEPQTGALLAAEAVRAVAAEAERLGVKRMTVSGPEPGRLAMAGFPPAGVCIYACGPWLPQIFPDVIGRRIQVTRQSVHYFETPRITMPCWIDFSDPRGGYTFPPLAAKSFKLALDEHGPDFDPGIERREVTGAETAAARAFLAERFPSLSASPVRETEVCQYESTSTGDFLLDRHPADPKVWFAGGGSGHGFKHGPAVAEYLVSVLDGAEAQPRFSLASKNLEFARRVY